MSLNCSILYLIQIMENLEELVTVVCYSLVPTITERVMTRSEFNQFNKTFKSKAPINNNGVYIYPVDLVENFKDWQFNLETRAWPGSQYEDRYFFRAYKGDVTACTDDCVYMDLDQSWREPFKNKDLALRDDPFVSLLQSNQTVNNN